MVGPSTWSAKASPPRRTRARREPGALVAALARHGIVERTVADIGEAERDRLRSRARAVRPRTENVLRLSRRHLAVLALEAPPLEDVERPRTRADCANVARPCPWVGCKHNLYL